MEASIKSSPSSNSSKATILFLGANPTDSVRLRLDEEIRGIGEGLRRASQRDFFYLEQRWAVRSRDLYRALLDTSPKVVHFSGHGSGLPGIVLEDDQGQSVLASTESLTNLFRLFSSKGVECIVLNACFSEFQAKAIGQNIPYVIGMSDEILDANSIDFAVAFYDAIAAGESYDFAFELACGYLQISSGDACKLPVFFKDGIEVQEAGSSLQIDNDEIEALKAKKIRLKELEKAVEIIGGLSQCSSKVLEEILSLRKDVENFEDNLLSGEQFIEEEASSVIPAPIRFISRLKEQQRIEECLGSKENWVRIIVLQGMGGTGKTALAAEVARKVSGGKLFKKVIWASANEASLNLPDLLDIILRNIGHRSDQLTNSQKQAKVSELFRKDSYLLVIDSFERIGDRDIDRFIAEYIFPPSKVLITTRYIWPPETSSVIPLGGLSLIQTRRMLEETTESQGLEYSFQDDEIQTIHDITTGLPLAIKLIVGQFSRGIPLSSVVNNLAQLSQEAHQRSVGQESWVSNMFDNLFGASWGLLNEYSQRILLSMTFFAAPASEEAIQVISDTPKERFKSQIDELINSALIQPSKDPMGGGALRHSIHPLTRSYLEIRINQDGILREAIYRRAVDHFISLMEELGKPGLELSSYNQLEQDLPNCLAAFEWSKNQRRTDSAARIVDSLNHFLFERGFWNTRILICNSASNLDQDISSSRDYEATWRQAFAAGWVYSRQNSYEEAQTCLEKAESCVESISEENVYSKFYQAKNLQLKALIIHGKAVEVYKNSLILAEGTQQAEDLFAQANNHHNNARTLLKEYMRNGGSRWTFEDPDYSIALIDSNQGDVFVDMGHWRSSTGSDDESRQYFESAQHLYSQVLENAQKSQWPNKDALVAFSAANLGHVEIWLQEKPLEEIRNRFDVALKSAESISRIHTIAWCYRGYGLLEQKAAQHEAAIRKREERLKESQNFLNQALTLFESIGRRERVNETKHSLREVEAMINTLQN